MEQQQFKVSFSVGTKLLVSVVLLLLIVILFLTISTIVVLSEDKRAYTYQTQAQETLLVGREFVNLAKRATDTLRLQLASVDPATPPDKQQIQRLESILNNQNDIISTQLLQVIPQTGASKSLGIVSKDAALKTLELDTQSFEIPQETMKAAASYLLQAPFTMINISKVGRIPLLAVLYPDLTVKNTSAGIPIAVGFVPLNSFADDFKLSDITITNQNGWILFSTDAGTLYSRGNLAGDPLYELTVGNKLAMGSKDYTDGAGVRYMGSYTRPGLDTIVFSKTPYRKAMAASYAMAEKFIVLGIISITAAILFAMFFSKTLTAPLYQLYLATKQVAQGQFDLKLTQKSRDEIGALSESFNVMSQKIVGLIRESMEKVQLENELAIASTVQRTLIPPPVYQCPEINIQSHYQSASQCGGDWWGLFHVGNKVCIMIADATGHGLPCALITASARSCFSMLHKLAQEDPDFTFSPSAMLSYANRVIYDSGNGQIMMTLFIGVIDFDRMQLNYASAGHNPPWLFKSENGGFRLNSLTAAGQRLGEGMDVAAYEEKAIALTPGDLLFLYTDGLMEGKNLEGKMLGKKQVRQVLEGSLAKGPEGVLNALVQEYKQHNTGKPLDDDVTIAVAHILGLQGSGNAAEA